MSNNYPPLRVQGKIFGNLLLWLVAGVALFIVLWGIGFGLSWWSAPWSGKLQARRQIQSGSFRIAAYNHFFDLCAAVQADEFRIDSQRQELATASSSDKDRILANIAGVTADRQDAIAQYNADAAKSYTIGQFRSSNLPYRLQNDPYTGGNKTSCVAL